MTELKFLLIVHTLPYYKEMLCKWYLKGVAKK